MEGHLKPPVNLQTRELAADVHAALRGLIHPHSKLNIAQLQKHFPHLFPANITISTQLVRNTIEKALERINPHYPEMVTLIRNRFWEGHTMQELSVDQGRSTSGLYSMQSQALGALAKALLELEQEAAANRAEALAHRCRNLPPSTSHSIFGAEEQLGQLQDWLGDPQGPRIISIEGLGGLGKTALAHIAVQNALSLGGWADCAWVSAVDRPFFLWEAPDTPPPLDPDRILEQIALQLGKGEFVNLSSGEKRTALQNHLSQKPYLIVLEDLEPEHRPKDFLPNLLTPTGSTRFLLTSRQRLPLLPGCTNILLHELPREASFSLLQNEAEERDLRISALQMEKAYSMVGGNPLALKLLVGQAASLPMERVMENLLATERGTLTETILQRIYRHSWRLLLPSSRQVLLTMVRFSPLGATYVDLQTATGLLPAELDPALQQLVTHSLLFFDPAQTDRYIIHRLTYIFLWTLQRGGVMSLI